MFHNISNYAVEISKERKTNQTRTAKAIYSEPTIIMKYLLTTFQNLFNQMIKVKKPLLKLFNQK